MRYPGKGFSKCSRASAKRLPRRPSSYEHLKTFEDPVGQFITQEIGKHFKAIQPENVERLSKLFGELEGLHKLEAVSEMISAVLTQGYKEYLKYAYPNSENRLEDLNQLMGFATGYDSLDNFLSELSLMSGVTGEETVRARTRTKGSY